LERSNPATQFEPIFVNLKSRDYPITYSADQMQWLAGSPLTTAIATLKTALAEDFDKVKSAIPEMAQFTFEAFLEMFSVINSRCFKSEDSDCVIPLMDKITFDHQICNCQPLFSQDGFQLIATDDIKRNQQLVI